MLGGSAPLPLQKLATRSSRHKRLCILYCCDNSSTNTSIS